MVYFDRLWTMHPQPKKNKHYFLAFYCQNQPWANINKNNDVRTKCENMEQADRGWEVEGVWSLPYKVKGKEMLSIADGAGNGGLIVLFEVEEEMGQALKIVI